MTTKVAYLHQNAHRNTFVDPKAAYRKLEEWNQPTFSNYFGVEIKTITYPTTGQLNVIRLKGQTPGALVMCGTTKELKASLNAFYSGGVVQGVLGDHEDAEKWILMCFVRGKSSSIGAVTKTLINIGGARWWWGATGDTIGSFTPHQWQKVPTGHRPGINFPELADILDDLEKPLEGESTVDVISW
jgi:hypothetical protein